MLGTHRDRGEPHDPRPPTPPDIRVRIRRFGGLSGRLATRDGNLSEVKKAFGKAMASAGLRLSRHGPCALAAVRAAKSWRTPRRRSRW